MTHLDRWPGRTGVHLALLPERARSDADTLDLACLHHHQPNRRHPATTKSSRWAPGHSPPSESGLRPPIWSGSSDRRVSSSQKSAADRRGWEPGTSTAQPTSIDLYREWAMAICYGRVVPAPPVVSPLGSSLCDPIGTGPSPAMKVSGSQATVRRMVYRFSSALGRNCHPARRSRLHGQRLGPDAASGLRRLRDMLNQVGEIVQVRAVDDVTSCSPHPTTPLDPRGDRFVADHRFPLTEPGRATFLFRGDADAVSLLR